jgi:hypothetical protein
LINKAGLNRHGTDAKLLKPWFIFPNVGLNCHEL